ncbi:MAG TPA: hypothetical protein VEW92_04650 [Nitrososphaeraceae archaeon]|jgi:hypothetical protein|nr:hypothetical protein [Nitrososphaeraceae archaeon]
MSTFNIIKQINKNYLVFFVLLSISSIYLFQSSSLENKNNIIKETYGIVQTLPMEIDYAHFISPLNQDNQVKVLLKSLTTADSAGLNNKTINAVMKVYSINGTLLKTSSYPQGFNYNNTESIKLATNIADKSIETVTAIIQLTNLEKTQSLSDPLTIKLGLGQVIDR